MTLVNNFAIFLAYLLGSIPTAVWIGKFFFNTDVRDYGSGNAGTTNTLRVLGKRPAIFVLLIDVLKGIAALKLAYLSFNPITQPDLFVNFQVILGIAAIVGHVFPVFAGFRGGKGIATMFGVLLGIHTEVALLCMAIFFVSLIFSNYVSLSSLLASIALPLLIFIAFKGDDQILLRLFALAATFTVIATHQKNIQRLVNGTESKTYIFKKDKK
jgi:acyl phosphate:glycerol-3-phosphate acyltransferase